MEVHEVVFLTNIKLGTYSKERDSNLQKVTQHWQVAEPSLESKPSDARPLSFLPQQRTSLIFLLPEFPIKLVL